MQCIISISLHTPPFLDFDCSSFFINHSMHNRMMLILWDMEMLTVLDVVCGHLWFLFNFKFFLKEYLKLKNFQTFLFKACFGNSIVCFWQPFLHFFREPNWNSWCRWFECIEFSKTRRLYFYKLALFGFQTAKVKNVTKIPDFFFGK